MTTTRFGPAARGLRGTVTAPPDKSCSHRAALLAAMSSEPVRITNYLAAADTHSTLDAVRALGALVEERDDALVVRGPGLRAPVEPAGALDVGNAGTLMRLLPGWLAGQRGGARWTLDGDASIRRRPVDRIAVPLRSMGAELKATAGRFPPFTVTGVGLSGVEYELPVASAQVKSCVLLAGLLATGSTTVVEPVPSRDHTERLLLRSGVPVTRNGHRVTVGVAELPRKRAARRVSPDRRRTPDRTPRPPPSRPPRRPRGRRGRRRRRASRGGGRRGRRGRRRAGRPSR